MKINVDNANMRIEGGKLIIDIDSNIEALLGLNKTELSKVTIGSVIKSLTDIEYIVLEHYENGTTRVIRKDLLVDKLKFDDESNNFGSSSINRYLNGEYLKKEVIPGFGESNIIDHEIDLLSLDGLDDYGNVSVKVGLLTIDDYRKYRKNCLKDNKDSWWWLSTPDSTPSGYGDYCVRCVRDGGFVGYLGYGLNLGVRPVLILNSDIFVSLAEK
jgi:hypothetical protein